MFDYECLKCRHRFEELRGAQKPVCPKCGGETTKIIGAPGLVFKGRGFHKTDYNKYCYLPGPDGK